MSASALPFLRHATPPSTFPTFYVRTDGNDANTGTANTSGGAWRHIDYAVAHVTADDVVRVQAGTYVETTSAWISGTSGHTVTLVADGAVTTCGMSFSSKSYIRVIGFDLDPNASSCAGSPSPVVNISGTNTGLEFWNNTVGNTQGGGYRADFGFGDRCDKCIWLGGSLHDIGDPGEANAMVLGGNDDFVGYVNFTDICWLGVGMSGNRQRYIGLTFSGFTQCSTTHPDFYYVQGTSTLGWSFGLVDGNFGIGTPTANDNKTFHAENNQATTPWNDVVWRFNVWHDLGSAAAFSNYLSPGTSAAQNRWRFYSNSHVYGDRAQSGSDFNNCGNVSGNGGTITFYVFNNIFYQCWADDATSSITPWPTTAAAGANYNLAYSPLGSVTYGAFWTDQANEQSNVNPNFVNVGSDDFHLGAGSGSGANARGTGGALTTATSCSGSVLNVATNTGSFFVGSNAGNLPQYSGGLVPGDVITVNATNYTVQSVSGDALTLTSAISCSNGDPVYFGASETIDIGAYPYKSGGYTLSATYSTVGGTVTITPNDASLVRFVVCYDSGVPYNVDNTSPYSCSTAAGTFSARVYPKYPSTTLYATASPA